MTHNLTHMIVMFIAAMVFLGLACLAVLWGEYMDEENRQ